MLREGDEPIPGYTLTRFLGKGTFGEVWQARTAGGFRAALKFVDLSVSAGLKEYRGIQRVKDIRHGRLMLMTALWMLDKHGEVIPDQLLAQFDSTGSGAHANVRGTLAVTPISPSMFVVAMPLADKSLLDLLDASGGRGIPLPDLIRYMEHAAEGLDFLNDPVHDLGEGAPAAIQHCDIKPANIMLMGNAAVICDFGLARILQADGIHRSVSGMAGTYPYMAPESIESPLSEQPVQPSRASDQYSLAVTYVELRTGRLPFSDEDLTSPIAILRAHCEGRLVLDGLTEAERKVITKATSVNPADRYASNSQLVRHLRRAVRGELDKAQALDPEASGDYSGTKVPSAQASAQRARADTDRVRDTVPNQEPLAAPRRARRLVLGLMPLLAAAAGGALLWNYWTPKAQVANPGAIEAPAAEPVADSEPTKEPEPEHEPQQPVTPPDPEVISTVEKPDPAANVADLPAQADQHAQSLTDAIAFETLLRRADESLAEDMFATARAALDEARSLAKGEDRQKQVEWQTALLAVRDSGVAAAETLDAFRRTLPTATTAWQARLTTAMLARIEQLDTAELMQWNRLIQAADENYFKVDGGAEPDDPLAAQLRDCRVQLHLRLGEALVQQADQEQNGDAAATEQLLKQAESSATEAIALLPKSSDTSPERKSKSRALGILGHVYYVQFRAADPAQRKQFAAAAIPNLQQAMLLAASIDDSARWRIAMADVQLQLARELEPELTRIQNKIAKLTLPADKKAVSERDLKPLAAEHDRLLQQAQAAIQQIPPTNPHRQHAAELFKALNVP